MVAHRVLPVPAHDPPYEGESATPRTPLDSALAPDGAPEPLPLAALAGASAECQTAARRFLMLCLEVCHGFRPPAQLGRVSRPAEAPLVVEEVTRLARRVAQNRSGARGDSVKPRRLRVCEPRPGIAEAAVVLNVRGTVIAFAFRLERTHATAAAPWLCTAAVLL